MARVAINTNSIHTLDRDAGNNPASVTADTIATGADNGFIVPYAANNILLFRNGTGGPATVTIKTVNPTQAGAVNLTVADKTVTVADTTELLYPVSAIFRQAGDEVYVDCDVAAEVAVLKL